MKPVTNAQQSAARITIVIPVYNEQECLPSLHARLQETTANWPIQAEYLFVNDGSSDRSSEILRELCEHDFSCRLIEFSRNFGHQAAVWAGLQYADGDVVAVIDADLQDPPEVIGAMIEKWQQGADVVYAVRTKRKEGFLKRLGYWGFYRVMQSLIGFKMPLDSGDFCLMDQSVVQVLRSMPERGRFIRGMRAWTGFNQVEHRYERAARQNGESKYTLTKLMRLALDGIFAFSHAPLKLSSLLGTTVCIASLLAGTAIAIWRITEFRLFGMVPTQAAGWTSLACLISFLSGLQMLVLGIIGEYLARLFDEVKARPPFVIANALGIDPQVGNHLGWFARHRSLMNDEQRPAPTPLEEPLPHRKSA